MTPGAVLDRARAREILARFSGTPVLVVGDVMLDRFIHGRVTRISPEAPVPVVRFDAEDVRVGGAANVAHNLAALGARVTLVGSVGADIAAGRLRAELEAAGIGADSLVEDPSRPTTEKVRIVTERRQQVARIDYERDDDVAGAIEARLIEQIARGAGGARIILVSDYLKGTVTRPVMDAIRAHRLPAVPLLVDPKVPHLDLYKGASLVTPNQLEAETATHRRIRDDADARAAAHDFRTRAECDAVLITRGEQGMWLSGSGEDAAIPALAREVADVTGAGDTVIATVGAALASGATLIEAAMLANQAAGISVGRFGPASVGVAEIVERF